MREKRDLRKVTGLVTTGIMIPMLILSTLLGAFFIPPAKGAWWNADWQFRKSIIIDHTKVSANLTNFPVLISITDSDLITKAQSDGDDIVFTDDYENRLNHEIEMFTSGTGKLVAWANVPNLSSAIDTTLYMYYGNSGCSNQQNKTGVWDSNYVMVQHLKETSGAHIDSTSNGNNVTAYNGILQGISGKIDGADTFDGTNDYLNGGKPSSLNDINPLTYECWVNLDSYGKLSSGRFFDKGNMRLLLVATYGIGFLQNFTANKGQWKTSNALGFGQWYYLVLTYDGSSTSNNPSIYLNGTSQTVTYYDGAAIPSGVVSSDAAYDWIIGDRSSDFARTYDGSMDEIRVSKVARSAAWISTSYNNQNSPNTFYTVGSEEGATPPIPHGPWWNSSWQYRKRLTVLRYSVVADLTGFPVLVDITDADLASRAQDDGDDIAFTDYGGSKLAHEIESFDGVTGKLTAWVRVPLLSSTNDTTIYMYYGNGGASRQESKTGVWDSNFVMVQHLKETSGAHNDSTSNSNNLTPYNGVVQGTSGRIDGADSFDGSDDYLGRASGGSIDNVNPLTFECWVNLDTYGGLEVGRFFDKGSTLGRLSYASVGSVGFLQNFTVNNGQWKTANPLSTGQWHYVAITYDSSSTSNNPRIYVNGVSQTVVYYSNITIPSGTAGSDAGKSLAIGNRLDLVRGLDGIMDEVRMSNTERSAAWISVSYKNQQNPTSFFDIGSQETGAANYPPEVSNENPIDGATDIPLNPTLRADIYDAHNDSVEWEIAANTTGTWTTLNSGTLPTGTGTITASPSNMNSYSTKYWWRVNATDPTGSGNSTLRLLSFTTRPSNYPPSLSNPSPADGAIDENTNPTLSIDVADLDADLMMILFQTNASGTWQTLGTYTNVGNGRYSQNTANMNGFVTKYYWSANARDAGTGTWTNRTYSFTTAPVLKLKYATMLPHGGNMLPVVGDINGDGIPEIVIRSNGQVSAMRGTDGAILWTRGYSGYCHAQLADLNNDGRQEILIPIDGSPCGLVALFGDGSEYWRRNDLGGDRVSLGPAVQVADTNRDGYLEVYFVSASNAGGSITGEISKLSYNGAKLLSTGPVVYYPCWGGMTLGDYDFDGEFELYIGERNIEYDPQGKGLRSWWAGNLTHRWDQIHILTSTNPPILADVNLDGKLEVIANAIHTGVAVINATDGSYLIDDRDIGIDSHCFGAIYDIDGDGHLELTVSNGQSDSNYHGFHVRDLLGRHTVSISLPYACLWPPRFGDVTGDGKLEMIAAPGVDGSTSNYDLFIYNQAYGLIAQIPVIGAGCLGPALVADVDGDGLNEVVVAGTTGKVLVYDTIAPAPTPPARTGVQGYSQYLQGAAEYVPPPGPLAPFLSDVNPSDGSGNVPTNPTLSVRIFDYQSDSLTIVFSTNASGSWQTIGTKNGGNGIYSQATSVMNSQGAKYYWRANVTDNTGKSTTITYSFTTYVFNTTWWNTNWEYRKPITINHAKVAGDLSNFPVLVDLTDTGLATHAMTNGYDIVFVDYLGSKLDHEIEAFEYVSGKLVAWVRLPTVFTSGDTMFYMYYGNPTAANQENAFGVWGSSFVMVQHLAETGGTHYDSTVNSNNVTPQNGVVQGTTGYINGGDVFDGNDDVLSRTGSLSGTIDKTYTLSAWINPADLGTLPNDPNPRIIQIDNLILFISAGPAGTNNVVNFVSAYHNWSTTVGQWCSFNNTISPAEGWIYLTVTYDGSSTANDAVIYKNGVPLGLWEWNTPSGTFNNVYQNLYVGDKIGSDRSYKGKIDEVRISNAARNAAWVLAEYNNQYSPSTFYTVGSEEESPQTLIVVRPTASEVSVGEDCIVYVNVTDVIDLYAWELQLQYNPSVLSLTSASLVPGGLAEPINIYYNLIDNVNGYTWWAASTHYPTIAGVTYSENSILRLQFRALSTGTSYLGLYGTHLSDSNGTPIQHLVVNSSLLVSGAIDLTVTSIMVLNYGCSIYRNDVDAYGNPYYYPVEVTISNIGNVDAGSFYVKLEINWLNGSIIETIAEIQVSSLVHGGTTIVSFNNTFRPTHLGLYELKATVDSRSNVTESNEENNTLQLSNVPVTIIGDVNGDQKVNILDAVVMAQAWESTPTDPWWNIKGDINHDGTVDIYDATRLSLHWAEQI